MQTSESFRLSALLSFSGGLQDAYTYNMRDKVFANAQTGNVVLMIGAFLITFAAVAVGMALEGIGDKISEILAL